MLYPVTSGNVYEEHHLDISSTDVVDSLSRLKESEYDLVFINTLNKDGYLHLPNIKVNLGSVQGLAVYGKHLQEIISSVYHRLKSSGVLCFVTNSQTLGLVLNSVDKICGVGNRLEVITWQNRTGTRGTGIFNSNTDFLVVVAKDRTKLNGLIESPFGEEDEFLYKDHKGKYQLIPVSVEKGYVYDFTYSGEKVYTELGQWKYPKEIIERGLDERFIITRGRYKRLQILEKIYMPNGTRPNSLFVRTENTNYTVIEQTFDTKTTSNSSIDVYMYFIRLFKSNNLKILDIYGDDGLGFFVVNWENNQSKTQHRLTNIHTNTNRKLLNKIKDSVDENIVSIEGNISKGITDLDKLYILNEGNILMKNPNKEITKATVLEVGSFIGERQLNNPLYIKTSDTSLIEDIRTEFKFKGIYGVTIAES